MMVYIETMTIVGGYVDANLYMYIKQVTRTMYPTNAWRDPSEAPRIPG